MEDFDKNPQLERYVRDSVKAKKQERVKHIKTNIFWTNFIFDATLMEKGFNLKTPTFLEKATPKK